MKLTLSVQVTAKTIFTVCPMLLLFFFSLNSHNSKTVVALNLTFRYVSVTTRESTTSFYVNPFLTPSTDFCHIFLQNDVTIWHPRVGRPRLIMHARRDDVIAATEQDGCERFGSEIEKPRNSGADPGGEGSGCSSTPLSLQKLLTRVAAVHKKGAGSLNSIVAEGIAQCTSRPRDDILL